MKLTDSKYKESKLVHGLAGAVKDIPFYNNKVAWSSMYENMFNGESLIYMDSNGNVLGYTLFYKYKSEDGSDHIILFQFETSQQISMVQQETIIKTMLFSVFDDENNIARAGDLVSNNLLTYDVLKQMGFEETTTRYLMNKEI